MRFKWIYVYRIAFILFFIQIIIIIKSFVNDNFEKNHFYFEFNDSWINNSQQFFRDEFSISNNQCDNHFIKYSNKFAVLNDVILDLSKYTGRKGGEDIKKVLNQKEENEFYKYHNGFIQIPCHRSHKKLSIEFPLNKSNHLNFYYNSLKFYSNFDINPQNYKQFSNKSHFFITRYEYANFYHTMTDWYITFIIMKLLNLNIDDIIIIITDAHPYSKLDVIWNHLFSNFIRLSNLGNYDKIFIRKMVWIPFGYLAPLMQFEWPKAPLINEFRSFVLRRYGIDDNKIVDCKKIKILFIWRHDYVAHPRNPSGIVRRKVFNEKEIFESLVNVTKNDEVLSKYSIEVKQIQLDQFSMKQQLEIISSTSILIGVHGAGLTHTLFLPKHAGLLELFPIYHGNKNVHFKRISLWRNINYRYFVNRNHKNEKANYQTYFEPNVIIGNVKVLIKKLQCF